MHWSNTDYWIHCEFFKPAPIDESESPQVSRTFQSIQSGFCSAVIWIVLILTLISSLSNSILIFLGTVSSAQTMIAITAPNIFLSCFSPLAKFNYLSNFSPSFILPFCGLLERQNTLYDRYFFLLISIRPGLLVWILGSLCISKSQWTL